MKIGFLHYTLDHDGVTTVVRNNAQALVDLGHEVTAYAGSFKGFLPDSIERSYLPFTELSRSKIVKRLKEISLEEDVLIFENPTLGIFPEACLAIQEFVEDTRTSVVYRAHDLLQKRSDRYLLDYVEAGGDPNDMYPIDATVLTLTKFDQKFLKEMGISSIHLPNSVDVDGWAVKHEPEEVRYIMEKKTSVSKTKKIVAYPGRFDPRKNHPEAIAITKALGPEYTLVGTLLNNVEEMKRMASFASEMGINYSFGQVGNVLDELHFGLADFLAASDLVITTSLNEGFGFNFIEPWIMGVPILGRNLPDQTQDFEENGISLSHLYTDCPFPSYIYKDNVEQRMEYIRDNPKFGETLAAKILDQKKDMNGIVDQNRIAVIDNYSSETIGRKLERIIKSKV